MKDKIHEYYEEELSAFKKESAAFAKLYPEMAAHLCLLAGKSWDPEIQALIETFAFYTARIRYRFEQDSRQMARSMMQLLCPEYLQPHPAYAIVEMQPKPSLATAQKLPPSSIFSKEFQGQQVLFQAAYATTLLPLKLTRLNYAREVNRAKACLTLDCELGEAVQSFASSGICQLRFYLQGGAKYYLRELWQRHLIDIQISGEDASGSLPTHSLKACGFSENEAWLPYQKRYSAAYAVLMEYFAYPEKFFFLELTQLEDVLGKLPGRTCRLAFYFDHHEDLAAKKIEADSIKFNVLPLINLFPQTIVLANLDFQASAYHLRADAKTPPEYLEIYQVNHVLYKGGATQAPAECLPYFSYQKFGKPAPLYWFEERRPVRDLGYACHEGEEVFLSFSEASREETKKRMVLTVDADCCHRNWQARPELLNPHLPWQIAAQALAQLNALETLLPIVPTRYPHREEEEQALLSHLLIQQLGYESSETLLAILKTVISLYDRSSDSRLAETLISAEAKSLILKHPSGLKQGWCRGQRISLGFSGSQLAPHRLFLFGSVLKTYFERSRPLNSLCELELKNLDRGETYQWPAT